MEIILTIAYLFLFIFLIHKLRFFEIAGLSKKLISAILVVKVAFGVSLWVVYTYYYTDRTLVDVFKYFDDSKVMYNALFSAPGDYLKMLSGFGNNTPHFAQYYSQMNNWYREYESNLYNDNHTIIRINALFRIFSFGYYNVHTVFMCFLSLIGLVSLYKFYYDYLKTYTKWLILALFFMPSVLFWGSGVMKEALIFLALGLLLLSAKRIMQGYVRIVYVTGFLAGLLLLYYTKFYVLITIVPALVAWMWALRASPTMVFVKYMLVYSVCGIVIIAVGHYKPNYNMVDLLRFKQKDFMSLANGGTYLKSGNITVYVPVDKKDILQPSSRPGYYFIKPGSQFFYFKTAMYDDTLVGISGDTSRVYKFISDLPETSSRINLPRITSSYWSLLRNAPNALINSTLRPYFWESNSILMILPGIEILFIVLMILLTLISLKKLTDINFNIVLFCLSYVVTLYLIVGWTTPVLGAIVRYKVPAISFLLIAAMTLSDPSKLFAKIPILRRLFGN